MKKKSLALLLAATLLCSCTQVKISIGGDDTPKATETVQTQEIDESDSQIPNGAAENTEEKYSAEQEVKGELYYCAKTDGGYENLSLDVQYDAQKDVYFIPMGEDTAECHYAEQYEGYSSFLMRESDEEGSHIIVTFNADRSKMEICSSGWYGNYNGIYKRVTSSIKKEQAKNKKVTSEEKKILTNLANKMCSYCYVRGSYEKVYEPEQSLDFTKKSQRDSFLSIIAIYLDSEGEYIGSQATVNDVSKELFGKKASGITVGEGDPGYIVASIKDAKATYKNGTYYLKGELHVYDEEEGYNCDYATITFQFKESETATYGYIVTKTKMEVHAG